jgi:hypothetical protein
MNREFSSATCVRSASCCLAHPSGRKGEKEKRDLFFVFCFFVATSAEKTAKKNAQKE